MIQVRLFDIFLEQAEADNTEMQNIQTQIKDLSDDLATLEGSFNSIVGEETQRQRYEDVTTDSKLRIEFADTRSMYELHCNDCFFSDLSFSDLVVHSTNFFSVKLLLKFKARMAKFSKEKEEVEYVKNDIARLIDQVKKLEEKAILIEQLNKSKRKGDLRSL